MARRTPPSARPSRAPARDSGVRRSRRSVAAAALVVAAAAGAAVTAVRTFVPAPSFQWRSLADPAAAPEDAEASHRARQPPDGAGRRAALGLSGAALLSASRQPALADEDPKITGICEFKIKIGNLNTVKPKYFKIGVFGDEAPVLSRTFLEACGGRYPGETGSQVNYYLSDVKKIIKGKQISWADFKGGNTFSRQVLNQGKLGEGNVWVGAKQVAVQLAGKDTLTDESNSLRHDKLGRVSMKRGGGSFDFNIAPVESAPWLDKDNVVIGQVIEGLDVIPKIDKEATTTAPEYKPLKRIRVLNVTLKVLDPETNEFVILPQPLDEFARLSG